MNWPFFKRDPSNNLGAYFVEIQNEAIDFDNPVIKELVDDLGGLETWPQLTLQQFKDLTEGLQHKLALGTGEIVEIGDVNYLLVDPDTDKVQESGLSWDNATVPPDMENFVISTVSQVLNDEEVRTDDQISYSQLQNALIQLISAAETLTDLDERDMPVLPDDDAYTEALESNQKLQVQTRKLSETPTVETLTTPVSESSIVPVVPKSLASDELAVPVPPVQTPTGELPAMSSTDSESNGVAQKVAPFEGNTSESFTASLLDKVRQFKVLAEVFKLDENLIGHVVSPEDEAFVDVMMARQKAEANKVLMQAAQGLTTSTQQDLLQTASAATFDTDAINKLLANDWQTPLLEQVSQQQHAAFANRLAKTKQNLETLYEEDVSRENVRHENALIELKSQLDVNLEKMAAQNELDRDAAIQAESAQLIAKQNLYIDKEVAELRYQTGEIATHQIIDQMLTRQTEAERILADILQNIKNELENDRQKFVNEHERALEKRKSADEATTKMKQAEKETYDVLQLESSKRQLETERLTLHEKIMRLETELSQQQTTAKSAQVEVEHLAQRISEMSQNENQTALIAALVGLREQQPAQKKRGWLKNTALGSIAFLALSGVGYSIYHTQTVQAEAKENVRQTKANYEEKTLVLRKQVTKATKQAKDASKAAKKAIEAAQSSESAVATEESVISDAFQALDWDIAKGSLKIYYQQFENADLSTEVRTLAVGKLMVDMNNLQGAKQLAAANAGHNAELLSLINAAEVINRSRGDI